MAPRVTRRSVLGASAGALALGLARGSSASAGAPRDAELFAFRAPHAGYLVFAVVGSALAAPVDVRIHTDRKSWTMSALRSLQAGTVSEHSDGRLFAGEVHGRHTKAGTRHNAVVIEIESPPDFVSAGESLGVWAEIHGEDGSRHRVGSPFVAELLARDPVLSNTYHAASPVEDRALFTEALATRIATMASRNVADPDVHARRLTARLLPDVIAYHPDLPAGFNFASQNGCHPADDTASVVATVLTGAVAPRRAATPFQLSASFPYFRRARALSV